MELASGKVAVVPEFTDIVAERWQRIADGENPSVDRDVPGVPVKQIVAEIRQLLAGQE